MIRKEKIKDIGKDEADFKWKKIKHNPNSNNCLHCKYSDAENSLKDKITQLKETDKMIFIENNLPVQRTFRELTVKRGNNDDVIGWEILWQ